MFLLHGHFLRINGLIDADGLKNSGAGGRTDEWAAMGGVQTLPDTPPLPALPAKTPWAPLSGCVGARPAGKAGLRPRASWPGIGRAQLPRLPATHSLGTTTGRESLHKGVLYSIPQGNIISRGAGGRGPESRGPCWPSRMLLSLLESSTEPPAPTSLPVPH